MNLNFKCLKNNTIGATSRKRKMKKNIYMAKSKDYN